MGNATSDDPPPLVATSEQMEGFTQTSSTYTPHTPDSPSPHGHGDMWQPNITITRKDELLHHIISDEELQMLSDLKRDWTLEAFWGSVGAAVGAAKGAITAMWGAYGADKTTPISWVDLFEIVLFFISIAVGSVLLIVFFSRSAKATNLVSEIRKRKREE